MFSRTRYLFRCSPSINTTLTSDVDRLVNLRMPEWGTIYKWTCLTSVTLRALRRTVDVCHVSMRLLAATWMGRLINWFFVERGRLSEVCQVSIRLLACTWIGRLTSWFLVERGRLSEVCQVSTWLRPSTWMGRWTNWCFVDCDDLSNVCQVSMRLWPVIWIGLSV